MLLLLKPSEAGNIGQSDMVVLQLNNKTAGPQVQLEPIKKIVSGLVNVHASIKVGIEVENSQDGHHLLFQ